MKALACVFNFLKNAVLSIAIIGFIKCQHCCTQCASYDTVGSTVDKHEPSVIDVVIKKRHLHLVNHPIIVAILNMKWKLFARFAFQRYVLFYAVFLALFTW